jgi:predicted transcriptional regulator of viral defense system
MMKKLLRKKCNQTVFTLNDIATITGKQADGNLISSIHYYVKTGQLIRLSKGIYALEKDYSIWEFANKLRKPSYISFYTILQSSGIIFQPYYTIFLACNRSEEIKKGNNIFKYRKLKNDILLNTTGIEEKDGVMVATQERALLDKVFLDKEEYFDNLRRIDWKFAKRLNEEVYQSKKIEKFIFDSKNV